MGLNALFGLIAAFTTAGFPTSDAILITMLIFGPAATFPSVAWGSGGIVQLINTVDFTADFLVFIGAVVPSVVAMLVASFLAENPKDAFGALTLSLLLSCGVFALLYGIGQGISAYVYIMWLEETLLYGALGAIIMVFIGGIVNSFFYGAIAMLITKAGL